jgi:hypothetical protein
MAKSQHTVYFEDDDPTNNKILEKIKQPGTNTQAYLREILNIGFLAKQQGYFVEDGKLNRFGYQEEASKQSLVLTKIVSEPIAEVDAHSTESITKISNATHGVDSNSLLMNNLANLSLPLK